MYNLQLEHLFTGFRVKAIRFIAMNVRRQIGVYTHVRTVTTMPVVGSSDGL